MPFLPRPCAEFPNDNPDLHDGASWVCGWTRAQPRAVLSARATVRMSAAPPLGASLETRNEAPSEAALATAQPSFEGAEHTETPLESDVRLVVPVTEVADEVGEPAVRDIGNALQDAKKAVQDIENGVQGIENAVQDIEKAVQDTQDGYSGALGDSPAVVEDSAEVEDEVESPAEALTALANAPASTAEVTDVESYFAEMDRKVSVDTQEVEEQVAALSTIEGENPSSEEDAPATFALVSEPYAPIPDVAESAKTLATAESETETERVARDSFTPKDDRDLETAFSRFIGVDPDDLSQDLSALISATREPIQTAMRPGTPNDSATEATMNQLELDLSTGSKQFDLRLGLDAPAGVTETPRPAVSVEPNSSAAPEALMHALDSLDDAFDEPIEFTPSAPVAVAIIATTDVEVALNDEKAQDEAPPSAPMLDAADIASMQAALADFDEPIEFTPSAPIAKSDEPIEFTPAPTESSELVELTPSAALAEALAAEAELANADAELGAVEAVDEEALADEEAIAGAVAALDELFEADECEWHTPVSQVAVRQETESHRDEASDDPEADIATRRLVLATEDEDEETVSLSSARVGETVTEESESTLARSEDSGSFRVPLPEAFDEPVDATDEEDDSSLEPLSLELTPPPPGVGGWDRLADFIAGFLLVRSATRAAALLPELLEGKRVNLSRLPEDTIAALCAEGIADRKPEGVFPSAAFRQQANALHLDFMSGRAPTKDLIAWLSVAVRALLGNSVSEAAAAVHLEQAGITKLLQRAA